MVWKVASCGPLTGHGRYVAIATAGARRWWSTTSATLLMCDEVSAVNEASLARTADDDVTCQLHTLRCLRILLVES